MPPPTRAPAACARAQGMGDADYAAAFELVVAPIAADFAPSLVIIAAGFDAAEGDPLGQMAVSPDGYHIMTEHLVRAAAGGKVVAALEGGYALSATATSAEATLRGLLGEPAPALGRRCRPRRATEGILRHVVQQQKLYWPRLRGDEAEKRFKAFFSGVHAATAALGGLGIGDSGQRR